MLVQRLYLSWRWSQRSAFRAVSAPSTSIAVSVTTRLPPAVLGEDRSIAAAGVVVLRGATADQRSKGAAEELSRPSTRTASVAPSPVPRFAPVWQAMG